MFLKRLELNVACQFQEIEFSSNNENAATNLALIAVL
jgi:hypothetical protein